MMRRQHLTTIDRYILRRIVRRLVSRPYDDVASRIVDCADAILDADRDARRRER